MTTKLWLEYATFTLVALCSALPLLMWRKGLIREFRLPAALLCIQAVDAIIRVTLLYFRKSLGIPIVTAYDAYFWGTWTLFFVEGVLRITIIYSVFREYMRPMQGLNKLGRIVFRWVAAVSVIVAIGFAAGPRASALGLGKYGTFTHMVSQAQQGVSILTLCLLLFVCFSTKPLGLTYRSHLFGVSVGLGILAVTDLFQAAWISSAVGISVYSGVYLFGALGVCAAFTVWGVYFAMPEAKRRMILLPTTSPFFFWNSISEALGDRPGHVAIAGFHPEMLAAAEVAMFSAPDKRTAVAEPAEDRRVPQLQSVAY